MWAVSGKTFQRLLSGFFHLQWRSHTGVAEDSDYFRSWSLYRRCSHMSVRCRNRRICTADSRIGSLEKVITLLKERSRNGDLDLTGNHIRRKNKVLFRLCQFMTQGETDVGFPDTKK